MHKTCYPCIHVCDKPRPMNIPHTCARDEVIGYMSVISTKIARPRYLHVHLCRHLSEFYRFTTKLSKQWKATFSFLQIIYHGMRVLQIMHLLLLLREVGHTYRVLPRNLRGDKICIMYMYRYVAIFSVFLDSKLDSFLLSHWYDVSTWFAQLAWRMACAACLQMWHAHSCAHSSSCRLCSWRVLKALVCINLAISFRILQHVYLSLIVLIR